MSLPNYAELHCASNFSFLRGASHAEELAARAAELGYSALAITDECSLAGVVRAHIEAKKIGLPLIIGSQFRLTDQHAAAAARGPASQATGNRPRRRSKTIVHSAQSTASDEVAPFSLILLAQNREGYGNLCELITLARTRADKGSYLLTPADFTAPQSGSEHLRNMPDCLAILTPGYGVNAQQLDTQAAWMAQTFAGRAWIALTLHHRARDEQHRAIVEQAARDHALPVVATGDVCMHLRSRKPLQDTLTAIRLGKPLKECGYELAGNAEQHLRTRLRLANLYPPEALAETVRVAERCTFSLDELRYEYPDELVPPGITPAAYLRQETMAGARDRFPAGVPAMILDKLEHELTLISEMSYEPYFLTVYDIVRFARSQKILCQGRGSAANSAVCYCLGITAVDPIGGTLLFERFISRERNEPPDIDVDFEHQRREEVIQYIYNKYGRLRAALTGVVISYRPRSVLRDVGKALGVDQFVVDQIAKSHRWWDRKHQLASHFTECGMDPDSLIARQWTEIAYTLLRFPRHLSQHPGGFVIARGKLSRMVPIENAAMENRSVVQWDKDDLDALGLLKVDILALGMLSMIRRALGMISVQRGEPFELHQIPREDSATYDMICNADTVGVFQIESRAQMSMLPRLRPREFYDLVIEVAIVRPGPIQGGMVHPYLRRKQGLEKIDCPPGLEKALGRTLGIPIFQEQVMQIAMQAGGFTAGKADELRRAMAAWRRKGNLEIHQHELKEGMRSNGYEEKFVDAICKQIEGFAEYGFPESHAASFALLAYASAWLKCHEPAIFLAALLNSQPMGFYSPSQLVQDAKRHGIEVRAVDVAVSDWEATLEALFPPPHPKGTSFGAHQRERGREREQLKLFSEFSKPRQRLPSLAGRTLVYKPVSLRRRAVSGPNPVHHPRHSPTDTGSGKNQPAVRLGLNLVSGLSQSAAERIQEARAIAPFADMADLGLRAQLTKQDLQALADANALESLAGHRRQALWQAVASMPGKGLLKPAAIHDQTPALPAPSEAENIVSDYRALGLTLGRHPVSLLRAVLLAKRFLPAEVLNTFANGQFARGCGIVTMRQRPETAKGTMFVTLEDETGLVNVIVWPGLVDSQRKELLGSSLLGVYGIWQCESNVRHLVAKRVVDLSHLLGALATHSRDFA